MKVSQKNLKDTKGILVIPFFDNGKQAVQVINETKPFLGLNKEEFNGKLGKTTLITDKFNFQKILLFGLGAEKDFQLDFVRRMGGTATRYAMSIQSKEVNVVCRPEWAQAATEGIILASYKCVTFKSKLEDYTPLENGFIVLKEGNAAKEIQKGLILATSQNYVREINEGPANVSTPEQMVEHAKNLAKENQLKIEVLDKEALKKKKMNTIIGVNQGSVRGAYLVTMEYNSDKKNLPLYSVVGKGITFDSGGLSLKPAQSMMEMKYDKTGACVVLGVAKAVSELQLPIRLIACFTVTENMPSGSAQRPGDIVTSYNGKTIEILNTDAEGRLILSDTLAYVAERKPEVMIDIATLTGACIIALGSYRIGMYSNDNTLAKTIYDAGEQTYERVWRMPLDSEYLEMMKSDLADLRNVSDSYEAGSITAACFLKEFIGDTKWIHLDIAGVDNNTKPQLYLGKGATGIGVRLIVETFEGLTKK